MPSPYKKNLTFLMMIDLMFKSKRTSMLHSFIQREGILKTHPGIPHLKKTSMNKHRRSSKLPTNTSMNSVFSLNQIGTSSSFVLKCGNVLMMNQKTNPVHLGVCFVFLSPKLMNWWNYSSPEGGSN